MVSRGCSIVLQCFLLHALLMLPQEADAKVQFGKLAIGGWKQRTPWVYLAKFGFTSGTNNYAIRLRQLRPFYNGDLQLTLEAYLDDDWLRANTLQDPCERKQFSSPVKEVLVNPPSFSDWINGTIHQTMKPHIWYFALSACNTTWINEAHYFRYEFHATQENGSQLSAEQQFTLLASGVTLCASTIFTWVFGQRCWKWRLTYDGLHPVIRILAIAIMLGYIAQLFHTCHLAAYRFNGNGLPRVDFFSEMLFSLGQGMQMSLLILIGSGYTLLQKKFGELDVILPLCLCVAIIQILLIAIAKMQKETQYKFHDMEGGIGWSFFGLKLLLWLWFLYESQCTQARGGVRLQSFLGSFQKAGSLYFLSFPVVFLIVHGIPPYVQPPLLAFGAQTLQIVSNMWLASLFLLKGEYFKVSTLSESDLPGGCRVGYTKAE